MKKYIPLILAFASTKLIIQLIGNRNYGFHRDELLHLSVGEHLAWGYYEFPPLIGWLGGLSQLLFDQSLMGTRLFPTLAGVAMLVLCCLMAKELGGGNWRAMLLAGACMLAFMPYYRNHTLFQPVAFDQLWWVLGFYFIIRYIKAPQPRHLLFLGITLGLGLLTKYTIAFWALGALAGLAFYKRGTLYKTPALYLGAGLALLLFIPNIIWQMQHEWPVLQHMAALKAKHLEAQDPWAFITEPLYTPFTLLISLVGLYAMLAGTQKQYRAIGVAVVVTFALMWLAKAKPYYLYGIYPVLFASGSVAVASRLQKRPWLSYVLAAFLVAGVPFVLPFMTPVLPIERFVAYAGLEEEENGRIELTGDYADMFGWEEQVALVDSVYRSLSAEEQANCVLWAENYGEAGALKVLGKKYGLPSPICRHGSFWQWGYANPNAAVWISLGNEPPAVNYVFEEATLVKTITHKYAIGEENGIPLYLCRKPKIDIPAWWQAGKDHVFD